MKGSLYIGAVRGIKMYIHWSFSLLILYIAGSHLYDGGEIASLGNRILFILSVFGCVLLHELGHALSALRYGIGTHDITLLPIGGVARLEKIPENPVQELVVAAAGPAVNVLIALILYCVLLIGGDAQFDFESEIMSGTSFLRDLLMVNISLVLFNLIPAFPMDGGRMLRALLSFKLKRSKATRYAAWLGQLLAVGFMILGFFYNPFLLLIGFFIFMGARQESAHVSKTEMLKEVKVSALLIPGFISLNPEDTLQTAIDHLLSSEQQDFPVINEAGEFLGMLTKENLITGIRTNAMDSSVANLMTPVQLQVSPMDEVLQVYNEMMENGVRTIPVIENSRVQGLLTHSNIRDYFLVTYAMELRKYTQNSRP